MLHELFRLSEDEAELIQIYRTLPVEVRALALRMLQLQKDAHVKDDGNVITFSRHKRMNT